MYKTLKTVLSTLALMSTVAGVDAGDGLTGYYPQRFDHRGIVARVSAGEIVVSARRYALDANVRVHTLNTRFASPRALASGTEIGFNTSSGKQGVSKITEIWTLPDGTVELP
ncbi:MAG: hypothetical protein U9P00_03860 [Pseudomonadota bacterium]|nr:hypothetical protein [Pseudomonadota bacterium]